MYISVIINTYAGIPIQICIYQKCCTRIIDIHGHDVTRGTDFNKNLPRDYLKLSQSFAKGHK